MKALASGIGFNLQVLAHFTPGKWPQNSFK